MKKKQLDLGDLESVDIKPSAKKTNIRSNKPPQAQADLLDYTKKPETDARSASRWPIVLLTLLCLLLAAGLGYLFWQQNELQKALTIQEQERKAAFAEIDTTISTQLAQLGGLDKQVSEAQVAAEKKLTLINADVEAMQSKLKQREASLNANFDSAKEELSQLENLLKNTEAQALDYANTAGALSSTITEKEGQFTQKAETFLQSLSSASNQATTLKQEIKVQSQLFEENTQVFKDLERQLAAVSTKQTQLEANLAIQNQQMNEINGAINAFDAHRREVNQRLLSLEFKNSN